MLDWLIQRTTQSKPITVQSPAVEECTQAYVVWSDMLCYFTRETCWSVPCVWDLSPPRYHRLCCMLSKCC